MHQQITKFKEEYRKAYEGILDEETLSKGNEFFEAYLSKALEEQRKEIIELIQNKRLYPAISYEITDVNPNGNYTSKYIDVGDFELYLKRFKKILDK